jgi:hypothetical protein
MAWRCKRYSVYIHLISNSLYIHIISRTTSRHYLITIVWWYNILYQTLFIYTEYLTQRHAIIWSRCCIITLWWSDNGVTLHEIFCVYKECLIYDVVSSHYGDQIMAWRWLRYSVYTTSYIKLSLYTQNISCNVTPLSYHHSVMIQHLISNSLYIHRISHTTSRHYLITIVWWYNILYQTLFIYTEYPLQEIFCVYKDSLI